MVHTQHKSWKGWYAAVIIALLLQLIFYYWFTQYWS